MSDGVDKDRELKDIINRYADACVTDPATREAWPYVPVADAVVKYAREYLPHQYPVSLGCALIHQESWFRNIFGCDWGKVDGPPYCQEYVTRRKINRFLANYYTPPVGGANGIGLTQLTTISLVEEAEEIGGVHIPRNQIIVGFRYLGSLMSQYGYHGGIGAYNAGPGNRYSVRWTYTAKIEEKHNLWISRLA